MNVDLLCRRCMSKLGEIERKKDGPVLRRKLCDLCKKKSIELQVVKLSALSKSEELRSLNSKRMKENNPMADDAIRIAVAAKLKARCSDGIPQFCTQEAIKKRTANKKPMSDDHKKILSQRMKTQNPMFSNFVKDKMSKTLNGKIQSGEIKYKRGSNHHLWKGGCRDFNVACRSRLYLPWTKKVFERDKYICTVCSGKPISGCLHVHHIKPLNDFINDVKQKYAISSFKDIDKENWTQYIDEVVSNHRIEDGITVCPKCHNNLDRYFYNINDKGRGR